MKRGRKHGLEYEVKGHYRHYKNGKIIYIKGYKCCKDINKEDICNGKQQSYHELQTEVSSG